MKLHQRLKQALARRLRNHVAHTGIAGSTPLPGLGRFEPLPSGDKPEVLTRLADDVLLDLIARGDPEALGALYDRYGCLVFAVGLRIAGTRRAAEILTEDVFQIVWRHVQVLQGGTGSIGSGIVAIARRSALDKIECRHDRSHICHASLDAIPDGILPPNGPADQENGFRENVRLALAALPAAQRRVLELAYYAGLTTREIAAVLKEPDAVVKARLRLGLATLRDVVLPPVEVGQPTAPDRRMGEQYDVESPDC